MAKIFLLTLLNCMLQIAFTPIFAVNEPVQPKFATSNVDFCDAPAPHDFHVISIGSDLVSLGWIPAWVGAAHTLEISIEDAGIWVTLFTDYNVPGDTYTLNDLEPGYYQARISSNCPSGETSINVSELEFDFKIIDLTTAGRLPANPVAVEDCSNIQFWQHEWVGFRVTEIGTQNSNLFEINLVQDIWQEHAYVRRAHDSHIVAVNNLGIFPILANQKIQVFNPFRMDDKSKSEPIIGHIELSRNLPLPAPPTITLCALMNDPTKPWKSEYEFTALTAESVIISSPPNGGSKDKTVQDTIGYGKFKAQSPFKESLNIFTPRNYSGCGKTKFYLLNTISQVVLVYEFDLNNSQVSFPVASLSPEVYFLRIENDCDTQTLKIVKSE